MVFDAGETTEFHYLLLEHIELEIPSTGWKNVFVIFQVN